MGVIEHNNVIENAVTLGGGGAVEAPLTLTGTNPVQAPFSVVQQDTGTATAPNVMALTHSLSSGTAAAGLGAGLAFRLQRDDDVVRTAAALVAQWLDAGGLGELRLTAYDNTTAYTARFSPTGLYLPNASGTPDLPINGVTLWAESGTLTVKGPDGVAHALPGAGGDLTPPVLIGPAPALLDGDTSTYPLVVSAAVDATNSQNTTMILGNPDPAYGLDGLDVYSGSNTGVYVRSTSGAGINAASSSGVGLIVGSTTADAIQATGGGTGRGLSALSDSAQAVYGESAGGVGVHGIAYEAAAVSAANTGSSGKPALQALSSTGPALQILAGWIVVPDQSEPATPTSGVVQWAEAGVLKWKGPDGVVH